MVERELTIAPRFEQFFFDWSYETYLTIGAYGSGKSHHIAGKIACKLLEEKRKALVVRETYESIKDSCFSLFLRVLREIDMLEEDTQKRRSKKVMFRESPMKFIFPNGSRIIFKGLDKPGRIKSLDGVSIAWIEECSEIKRSAYQEILGRIREPGVDPYFFLSCNPTGLENWVYKEFFVDIDKKGKQIVKLDDRLLYKHKTLVKNGIYYHHSTAADNPFIDYERYMKRIDRIKDSDPDLWRIARHGEFGASSNIVLPQFKVAENADQFRVAVQSIPQRYHFTGFDFGFEESYNAVIRCAVDKERQILYIYDEVYENGITDPDFALIPGMQRILLYQQRMIAKGAQFNPIVADSSAPKDIKFYKQHGFRIRACENRGMGSGKIGTRIQNTKKMKRFTQIICSPRCPNTIRELSTLTYKKDRNDVVKYSEFNIDPHSFSALWYALDKYTVADLKEYPSNSYYGSA